MARILVIDDNDEFRGMMSEMLKNEGYEVVAASDGKEGVAFYHEQPTDLVITDVIMPEKDGVETIVELSKEFPDVKLIVISGGGEEGSGQDYLNNLDILCNIQHFFEKPFAMDEFLQAVKELVNQ